MSVEYSVAECNALTGEYNGLMGEDTVKAWVCDVCGYVWLKVAGRHPEQCASKACRSRKWNSGAVVQRSEHRPHKPTAEGSIPSGATNWDLIYAGTCKPG